MVYPATPVTTALTIVQYPVIFAIFIRRLNRRKNRNHRLAHINQSTNMPVSGRVVNAVGTATTVTSRQYHPNPSSSRLHIELMPTHK
jgi:hypothetical protein